MSSAVDVVVALAAGRKAGQLYPPTHPEFQGAITSIVQSIDQMTETGPLTVNVHQGRLYHQSTVIPVEVPGVHAIQEAFESRKIESLTMHAGFGSTDAVAIVEVLSLRPSPSLDVENELKQRNATAITVALLADDDEEKEERERLKEQDRALYHRLIAVMRSVSSQVASGGMSDLGKAEGMVGNIMGRLLEDQSAVLGLATMRGHSEADLFHSINVMIYALTLGATLGLPEEGLSSLGVSALLHDVGKAAFDHGDPSQTSAMTAMHPKVGADILSALPDEDPAPMLVAYEHHMHVDGGGYPERAPDYVSHPFSRMVAIANRYANLTNPTDASEPRTPDRAIVQLLREAGSVVDPLFARLFAKAMGVFPVGCLVRLTDQTVGIVSRSGADSLTPIVRVVYDAGGLEIEDPDEVALADSELAIIEVVDPASLAVAIADHL